MTEDLQKRFKIALSWCLAWGNEKEPQFTLDTLQQMRSSIDNSQDVPAEVRDIVKQVDTLQKITEDDYTETIDEIKQKWRELWEQETRIGLVYGGATKIKQYVFESENLMEIRGASAILDRINLVDIPAFFGEENFKLNPKTYQSPRDWLQQQPKLSPLLEALIPELIVYSTGGNVLAFCPAAYVNDLADAIEKRYTHETITANSCAVGDTFRLLEIRFGLFQENPESTNWLNWYRQHCQDELVEAYFAKIDQHNITDLPKSFYERKSFNELAKKLAVKFNQRRSGNETDNRPSHRYPPLLETHPYLIRDENDRASALDKVMKLPSEPNFSEPLARKYLMGQITKIDRSPNIPEDHWFRQLGLQWKPGYVDTWVKKFEKYLDESFSEENKQRERLEEKQKYYQDLPTKDITETRALEEIANAGKGFISFISADGNNMGGYIQTIKTPEKYSQFSQDVFEATEKSVYYALAKNLHPHQLTELKKPELKERQGQWVHPFEIITIGGDDVLLIVPANKALEIARDIGNKFEEILESKTDRYAIDPREKGDEDPEKVHRYKPKNRESKILKSRDCQLSTSIGVLTISYNTPIYYAYNLASQLLKSAKKAAKELKNKPDNKSILKTRYYGGTVDFLTLKSVTMISSNISEFREDGLTKLGTPKLKLYASPYTFYELDGLIETVRALKKSDFPKSQVYQIRSLLDRGKRTAMLNYRYFRSRLNLLEKQELLKEHFEEAWCQPKDPKNNGNLAPWMSLKKKEGDDTIYETIWRELIDLYPFVEIEAEVEAKKKGKNQ
ncbi:type III-B CRISPR-associated protein Cas10/Cmr2 [Leptolyngbya valderiana BDU 20041]|nr:type III-B CRISPR-associated protein Cas10/Cmr2 [Leptolyngbya valderiana BDU 20041]